MINQARLLGCLGVSLILFVLTGTVAAGLPVGSVAIYSDGRVEKLLAYEDRKQLWEDDRKRRYLRSDNPIMPTLERRDFLSGKASVQNLRSGDPDSISVLPRGERVEFSVVRQRTGATPSVRIWECVRLGPQQKKVLGKLREVESYRCERFVYQRKTWQRQFRESREFLYSRELGLIVKMKRKTRKRESSWGLVSVIGPGEATYERLSRKVRRLRAPRQGPDNG